MVATAHLGFSLSRVVIPGFVVLVFDFVLLVWNWVWHIWHFRVFAFACICCFGVMGVCGRIGRFFGFGVVLAICLGWILDFVDLTFVLVLCLAGYDLVVLMLVLLLLGWIDWWVLVEVGVCGCCKGDLAKFGVSAGFLLPRVSGMFVKFATLLLFLFVCWVC